jgi:hypothetical protein
MIKKIVFLLVVSFGVFLVGCTENQRAKHFGGTMKVNLEPNKKLVLVTWKEDSLWILTRQMRAGETPETYDFKEDSTFNIVEGAVQIIESN